MLSAKPERKISWAALQTGAKLLLLPLFLLIFFMTSRTKYNSGIPLYIGILLFSGVLLYGYFGMIKIFRLLRKINLTNPITTTRRLVNQLERAQTKQTKIGATAMPIALLGACLIFDIYGNASTTISRIMAAAVIAVVFGAILYSIKEQAQWFKKLNAELDEIEQLEKE